MSSVSDISVLIATFNGRRHLREQLASILTQTLTPLEIVVADDGSTDETLSIVEAFRRQAEVPISVIAGSGGLGASQNFLNSLDRCRGHYIAFCDQDDVWKPTKLEKSRGRLQSDRSLLAIHQSVITDAQLNPAGVMTQGIRGDSVMPPGRLDPYLGEFSGWGNTMTFDACLIPLLLRPRPNQPHKAWPVSHDTWTYVLAAALGRVSLIAEPLLFYRQHENNVYGVEVESDWSRVQASRASPIDIYTERSTFYLNCASAFREAEPSALWNSAELQRASYLYEGRSKEVLRRRNIYTRKTRLTRLKALIDYYALGGPLQAFGENRGAKRLKSVIKDVLMGVWTGTAA